MEIAVRKSFERLVRALPFSLQRQVLALMGNRGFALRLFNEALARLDVQALALPRPEPLPAVAKAVIAAVRVIAPHDLKLALRGEARARRIIVAGEACSDFELLGSLAALASAMADGDPRYKTTAPKIAVSLAIRVERERLRLATMERQRQLVASNLLSLLELIHQSDVEAARDILRKVQPGLEAEEEAAGALAARIMAAVPARVAETFTDAPTLSNRAFFIATVAATVSRDHAAIEQFARNLKASGAPAFDPIRAGYVQALEGLLRTCGNPTGVDHPAPLRTIENSLRMQTDAERLLAPWRRSLGYELVTEREARTRARGAGHVDTAAAGARILFVANGNWFFLHEVITSLEKVDGIQCRTFDFGIAQQAYELAPREAALPPLDADTAKPIHGEAFDVSLFKHLIEWADVIFVEWCEWAAVWLSNYVPRSKRLVVRLHSYEAFAPTPHFINWANVDALIFVADHIMRFFNLQLGERLHGTSQLVVDNIRDLVAFECVGSADRDHVLGMLGYNNANKHPRMALAILRQLRAEDARWKLRLLGPPWPDDAQLPAHEREYKDGFFADLDAFGLGDAVEFGGEIAAGDVNRAMQGIGVILSCSDREGTHEAVVEGIVSGCVPLIRNWPTSAAYDGARNAYAPFRDWVFDSVEQAVAMLRAHGAPDGATRRALAEAGMRIFDKRATLPKLLNIIAPSHPQMGQVPVAALREGRS